MNQLTVRNDVMIADAQEVPVEHFWVTWHCAEGLTHDLQQMDSGHLHNLYKWLHDRLYYMTARIIKAEIERRTFGQSEENFEQLCWTYQRCPETDRLTIHGEPRRQFKMLKSEDPL